MLTVAIIFIFINIFFIAPEAAFAGNADTPKATGDDSLSANDSMWASLQVPNIMKLKSDLSSGKPTLAYFYYSVACSCAAAQCALASAALDSIPELSNAADAPYYICIDAYNEDAAESLYNIEAVPAIIGFDKSGKEVGRLEWFIDKGSIQKLIARIKYLKD